MTEQNDKFKCPCCKREFKLEDLSSFVIRSNGEVEDIECPWCGAYLKITADDKVICIKEPF